MMPRRPDHYTNRVARRAGGHHTPIELPVAVSHAQPEFDRSVHELFGHLKVSTHREYEIVVKHEFNDFAPKRYRPMSDPLNQCGPLFEEQVPVATGNDYESFMAAFNKRCNFKANDDIEDDVFKEAMTLIASISPPHFEEWDDNEADRERWINKFDPHKQARMRAAYDSIPDCTPSYLGQKDLSVKQEILLKRNDPNFAPRVIYAGNDAFNAVTGPACMVAMERLVELLQDRPIGGVLFMTAYKRSDVTLAEHLTDRPFAHVAEGDYSANDREQRHRVHKLFDALLKIIRMPSWFRDLLVTIDKFHVRSFAFGLSAVIESQLPTGTTSTTVRNSWYNIVMFAVSCQRQRLKGNAVVLGDDLLAVLNKPIDTALWTACVARFKMVLKAATPALNCHATFLSKRLLVVGDRPCMVPLLGKAIARFNARGVFDNSKTPSQYMAGKSLSYAYEFRHVPFMRDFFLERFALEDQSELELSDLTWFSRTSGVSVDNIADSIINESVIVGDDEFRDWVMEAYGVGLSDLQDLCELVLLSNELILINHETIHGLSRDW
jgi:hypothetical protein